MHPVHITIYTYLIGIVIGLAVVYKRGKLNSEETLIALGWPMMLFAFIMIAIGQKIFGLTKKAEKEYMATKDKKAAERQYNVLRHILRGGNIHEFDWVDNNYPDLMPYILAYISKNDDYTFMEAFESVDSVIYGEWRDSQ